MSNKTSKKATTTKKTEPKPHKTIKLFANLPSKTLDITEHEQYCNFTDETCKTVKVVLNGFTYLKTNINDFSSDMKFKETKEGIEFRHEDKPFATVNKNYSVSLRHFLRLHPKYHVMDDYVKTYDTTIVLYVTAAD